MKSEKIYDHRCPQCKENTQHVPRHRGFMRIVMKIFKFVVFFISFGMVYPHIFTEDDEVAVTCTKCGAHATISCG